MHINKIEYIPSIVHVVSVFVNFLSDMPITAEIFVLESQNVTNIYISTYCALIKKEGLLTANDTLLLIW